MFHAVWYARPSSTLHVLVDSSAFHPTHGRERLLLAIDINTSLYSRFMMCLVLTTATGLLIAISAAILQAAS